MDYDIRSTTNEDPHLNRPQRVPPTAPPRSTRPGSNPALFLALGLIACDATTAPEARSPGVSSAARENTVEPDTEDSDGTDAAASPADLDRFLGQPVHVQGQNLRIQEGPLEVEVHWLKARLVPAGDVVTLSEAASFDVIVEQLDLVVETQRLLGPYLEADPVNDAQLSTEDGAIRVEADLDFLDIPMTFEAVPSVTDGRVRLDVEEAEVVGIGVKPFLDLLEDKPEDVPGLLQVDGDQIHVDPSDLPGATDAEITFSEVKVLEDAVVMHVGTPPDGPEGDDGHLTLDGGVLRTGRSMLYGTRIDLRMRDGGPLVIDPGTFGRQMRRGFTKQHEGPHLTLNLVSPGDVRGSAEEEAAD